MSTSHSADAPVSPKKVAPSACKSPVPSSVPTKPRKRTIDLQAPQPSDNPGDYDFARYQTNKEYVRRKLNSTTRKVTPRQEMLLKSYDDALEGWHEAYLRGFDADKRERQRKAYVCRQHELDMKELAWAKAAYSDEEYMALKDVLYERQMAFYARYGECYQHAVDSVVRKAKAEGMPEHASVSAKKKWTERSQILKHQKALVLNKSAVKKDGAFEALEDEIQAEKKLKRNERKHEDVRKFMVIWRICRNEHIDFNETLRQMHSYGDRNATLHNGWDALLMSRKYDQLKMRLYKDWLDIDAVCPAHMVEEKSFQKEMLEKKMRAWYIFTPDRMYEPERWQARYPILDSLADELERDQDKVRQKIDRQNAEAVKRALDDAAYQRQLDDLFRQTAACQSLPADVLPEEPVGGWVTFANDPAKKSVFRDFEQIHLLRDIQKFRKASYEAYNQTVAYESEVNKASDTLAELDLNFENAGSALEVKREEARQALANLQEAQDQEERQEKARRNQQALVADHQRLHNQNYTETGRMRSAFNRLMRKHRSQGSET